MKCFAIIIDGEVATNYCVDDNDTKYIAIFSSNPTFIPVDFAVPEGSIWDGEIFIFPESN
jgi:hypothetical protein